MTIHLVKELETVKKMILTLGAMVERSVQTAVKSMESKDIEMATRVIQADTEIDKMEVEIEEECLKLLALHQPVAVDLRFIVAVIKINSELERIADQAVNIAERVINMARREGVPVSFDFSRMGALTQLMLKNALDSLVNLDVELARKVNLLDDQVDNMKRAVYDEVKEIIQAQPRHVGYLINLLLISRHLERIGDHATDIAQEVIYLIEGEIHRHRDKTQRIQIHA
jgi:phosphate transport system protein